MTRLRAPALVALLLALPGAAQAQRVGAALDRDTVTVGSVVTAAVRIEAAADERIAAPDSLILGPDLENAGRRTVRIDTVNGVRRVTLGYPIAAWRPGVYPLPAVPVRLIGASGERTTEAALPPITVLSVLPDDTAGIEPAPPKGIVGGFGFPWLWLLAGLLLIALMGLFIWWYRRRRTRRVPEVATTPVGARERALRQLDALATIEAVDRLGIEATYVRSTEILRGYVAHLHPGLSPDLTTRELASHARQSPMGDEAARALAALLEGADLVKYARRRPDTASAVAEVAAVRAWVAGYPPTPRATEVAA